MWTETAFAVEIKASSYSLKGTAGGYHDDYLDR